MQKRTTLLVISAIVLLLAVSAEYFFGMQGVYLGVCAGIWTCYKCVTNIVGAIKTWMECKCLANAEVLKEFGDLLTDTP